MIFFINKANSFISELSDIDTEKLTSEKDTEINGITTYFNSNHYKQNLLLKDIGFHIKLMLSEFDNGKIFIDRLDNVESNKIITNKGLKEHLLDINHLFISFLNEYRK